MTTVDGAVFSAVHARFAADLLSQCRTGLLGVSKWLDGHMDDERRLSRAVQHDDHELRDVRLGEIFAEGGEHSYAIMAYGDKPALIAGAAYAQWISDHLAAEVARRHAQSVAIAMTFAADADHLAVLQHEMAGAEDAPTPAAEPPPFPATLEEVGRVENQRARLDPIRDMLAEADQAILRSTTETMRVLHQHITALNWWAMGPPNDRDDFRW